MSIEEDEYLQADGFESALIGFVHPWPHRQKTAVYDREKCIQILIERDGMDRDEAEEFFDFNTDGAYVGEQTPLFLSKSE